MTDNQQPNGPDGPGPQQSGGQQPPWSSPDPNSQPQQQPGPEQQAYAQPAPGQPHPQQPGAAGEGQKSRPAWLVPVIALGAVVLLAIVVLIAVLAWIFAGNEDDEAEAVSDDEDAAAEDEEAAEADAARDSPTAVVEAYLTALSEGDLETAEAYLSGSFSDFTQEMLDGSLELAEVSDLQVEEASGEEEFGQPVDFSWTVGGEEHSGTVEASQDFRSEEWEVNDIFATASLTLPESSGDLDYTVNGQEDVSSRIDVVPGLAYEVDVDHENYTLTNDQANDDGWFLLGEDDYIGFSSSDLALTEEAEDQWRELIVSEVEECMDSGEAEPGCGLDIVYGNVEVDDGTVQRSMDTSSEQSLNSIEPRIDFNNPNLVSAWISGVRVDTLFEGSIDGEHSIYEVTVGPAVRLDDPVVDMSEDDPEVIWESYGATYDPEGDDDGEDAPDEEEEEEDSEFVPASFSVSALP
ncbi:hypothetical protein [Nesterenkonia populi]